jgi:hypothetical protein
MSTSGLKESQKKQTVFYAVMNSSNITDQSCKARWMCGFENFQDALYQETTYFYCQAWV